MVRDTNFFADQVAAKYPDLPLKEVRKLCQLLMRRLYGHATRDQDVRLTSGTRNLSLKVYTPDRSHAEHNERVAPEAKKRFPRRFAPKSTLNPPSNDE